MSRRGEKDDGAEKDLLAALKRLKEGRPTNPTLIARLPKGHLRINPKTVSMEAQRSRTLIGMKNCAFPQIRQAVLKEAETAIRYQLRQADVQAATAVVTKMKISIRQKDTALAAALLRIDELEKLLDEYGHVESNVRPIRSGKPASKKR